MFKFIVICALLATASAQFHGHEIEHGGNSDDHHAEIIHYDSDVHKDGFRYKYATTNHIEAEADGNEHGEAQGYFRWIAPEGEHIEISYLADKNGYQPKGDVLPTPPPTPEAIIKALQYIESHSLDKQIPSHDGEVHHGHRI